MAAVEEAIPFLPSGYSWTECPRWENKRLYFSDWFNARIIEVTPNGHAGTYVDCSGRKGLDEAEVVVAGIGFLPDGRLLINSMLEHVTLVWNGVKTEVYADLRTLARGPINDMVVDSEGRVYISQLGYDVFGGEEPRDAPIIVIEPNGYARIADEGGLLAAPNGMAITEDGTTLLVAEPNASRITAFERSPSGVISSRRVFAELEHVPDGICLDVKGGVWAAQPRGGGVIRVSEGGLIDARVTVPAERAGAAVACVLGGVGRKTLYVCCGFDVMDREKSRREARGSIWVAPVSVSGGRCRP